MKTEKGRAGGTSEAPYVPKILGRTWEAIPHCENTGIPANKTQNKSFKKIATEIQTCRDFIKQDWQ
jgi:hypothetical protein